MIIEHYEDLDEAYIDINRKLLTEPNKYIDAIRGAQGIHQNVFLTVDNPVCSIDLDKLGYSTPSKWTHLINTYIDEETLREFWYGVVNQRGLSWTFKFKDKKKNNGSCLLAIVFTRIDSKAPFTHAKVIWRTTEIQRRWAADLVLIAAFFRDAPEEAQEKIDIEEITLFIPLIYQSWLHVGPLLHVYGLEPEDLDRDSLYGTRVYDSYYRVYEDYEHTTKYSPTQRMKNFHRKRKEGKLTTYDSNTLSIQNVFNKKKKKRG